MFRSAVGKVMWVGRAAVFLVGLAVILALILGMASTALGANGQPFVLGKAANSASKATGLVGKIADTTKAALSVTNTRGGPAVDLRVGNASVPADDVAPMKVNSNHLVANLNADRLDGRDASDIAEDARPFAASVNADGSLARSNRTGISSVNLANSTGVYKVTLPVDVSGCMPLATTGNQTGSTGVTNAMIETARGDIPQSVFVETATSGGTPIDVPFAIAVFC